MIPILDLKRQYQRFQAEFEQALLDAASSTQYILGPNVQAFEQEAADYLGVKHAIGCASGTDALLLAMLALNIGRHNGKPVEGPQDEVITTPFTYIATSETIVQAGAKPVFTDVDPITFNMDTSTLEKLLTPQTKGIVPVHLYGQPANMKEILAFARSNNLAVIEDCAQAMGASIDAGKGLQKVGTFGDIGCFSFFPSKNLGCMGDGGMVTTNNDDLASRLRMLRVHGSRVKYHHEEAGLNSRLDDLQAAVLRIKLKHLDNFNAARRQKAERYEELLAPLSKFLTVPATAEQRTHVFHQYTIRLHTQHAAVRDAIQQTMKDLGVTTMIYYPIPLYEQETHAHLGYSAHNYPASEALKAQVLSLPMFPELTDAEQATVAEALAEAITSQPLEVWHNEPVLAAV